MLERFSCLRRKEVVNVCDGCRLGYVGDLEIKYPEGEIKPFQRRDPPPQRKKRRWGG